MRPRTLSSARAAGLAQTVRVGGSPGSRCWPGLDYAARAAGALPLDVLDLIEDLQEVIGSPLVAQRAMELYSALRAAGVQPRPETWCRSRRWADEDPGEAEKRLRLQVQCLLVVPPPMPAVAGDEMAPRA